MRTPDSDEEMPGDEPWDDLFRQRLADYTSEPPAGALDRILANLGPLPARRWLPISLALLLVVGGSLVMQQDTPPLTRPDGRNDRVILVAQQPSSLLAVEPGTSPPARPGPATGINADLTTPVTKVSDRPKNTMVIDLSPGNRATRKLHPLIARTRQLRRVQVIPTAPPSHLGGNTTGFTEQPAVVFRQSTPAPTIAYTPTNNRILAINALASRPFQPYTLLVTLPDIVSDKPSGRSQANSPVRQVAWFAGITPSYGYQHISPIRTDNELVSDIGVPHPLATNRLGGRLQVGLEWPLTNRLSLRTSLVYQQLRQSLHYAYRSTHPDSVRVVVVDNQSVAVTPVFTKHTYAETTVWYYTGLSLGLAWQLNKKPNRVWGHYLVGGATVGRYASRGGVVNGFVQMAYGIERPLSPSLRFRIEPTLQIGWQPLSDRANRLHSLPYGYGVGLSLRFR